MGWKRKTPAVGHLGHKYNSQRIKHAYHASQTLNIAQHTYKNTFWAEKETPAAGLLGHKHLEVFKRDSFAKKKTPAAGLLGHKKFRIHIETHKETQRKQTLNNA